MEFRKSVTNDPICKTAKETQMQDSRRDTDVKNRLLDSVAEGEGGVI